MRWFSRTYVEPGAVEVTVNETVLVATVLVVIVVVIVVSVLVAISVLGEVTVAVTVDVVTPLLTVTMVEPDATVAVMVVGIFEVGAGPRFKTEEQSRLAVEL